MGGYFCIGVYSPKCEMNIGTLWRSAYQLGAAMIFTIGRRYKPQGSDTVKAWTKIPFIAYDTWDDFMNHLPKNSEIIAIETCGLDLSSFVHPPQGIYLLGPEDVGLPGFILSNIRRIVSVPSIRSASYNVAVAGSLVLFDRMIKQNN